MTRPLPKREPHAAPDGTPWHLRTDLTKAEARALSPEQKEERNKHRAKDPKKAREYQRKYREADPEKTREKDHHKGLKKRYGITGDDYAYLSASQDSMCAVCHQPCKTGMRLAVDHCHRTNLVRGLLCGDCNTSAGKLGEDPARIMRLAAYILAHNQRAAEMIGLQIPDNQRPGTPPASGATEGSSN